MEYLKTLKQIKQTDSNKDNLKRGDFNAALFIILLGIFIVLFTILCATAVHAEEYTYNYFSSSEYCQAIYFAEGGEDTKHPYGILAHYKNTTPRQACINTVDHAKRDWIAKGRRGEFIDALAKKYCPINSDTDNGTCKYWKSNVESLLN